MLSVLVTAGFRAFSYQAPRPGTSSLSKKIKCLSNELFNRQELELISTVRHENNIYCVFLSVSLRINGQLVALKVIRMKTEEGIPFTAIREGEGVPTDCSWQKQFETVDLRV